MSQIIRHLSGMIPYMVLIMPIHIIVRLILVKLRHLKWNWYHEIGLFLFVAFIAGLASQTVIPPLAMGADGVKVVWGGHQRTALIPFRFICYTLRDLVVYHSAKSLLIDFLGNIVMFMPFGFFVPLLWRTSDKTATAVGFCVSLFIEISQLFLPRWTDIDDLILNTAGTVLGLMLYKKLRSRFRGLMDRFQIGAPPSRKFPS